MCLKIKIHILYILWLIELTIYLKIFNLRLSPGSIFAHATYIEEVLIYLRLDSYKVIFFLRTREWYQGGNVDLDPVMFATQNKEYMNNEIAYLAPRNKTIYHSMSLNNRISCVVGISMLNFDKYWKRVFYLMDLIIDPSFKQFLLSEIVNADKTKHTINNRM